MVVIKKSFILISCASLLVLSGCNKKVATQTDNDAEAVPEAAVEVVAAADNSEFNCTDRSWTYGLETDLKDKFTTIASASLQSASYGYDSAQFKQWTNLINFKVSDVRTDKVSSAENIIYCTAVLAADLPQAVLVNAYRADNLRDKQCTDYSCMLQSYVEDATDREISLESTRLSQNYTYSIEKSDSGSLVISRDTDPKVSKFLRNLLINGLHLSARQEEEKESDTMNEQMSQEEQEKYKLIADAMEIRVNEINDALAKKTGQLNTMWESKPKAFHDAYLANQKAWFKKRDVECRIEAQKPYHEIARNNREQYAFETDEWPNELIEKDKEIRFKKCVNERIEYRMNQLSEMK